MNNIKLKNLIDLNKSIIDDKIDKLLINNEYNLHKAIKYSLLCNGKRLRPLLIMEVAKLFNCTNNEDLIIVASAIEMIHIFSLIHDDLPSMDNDDYRRGEPTCHIKFNEYDALLAGDSLIPLCFETILNKTPNTSYEDKCKIILIISEAIGYKGMCLGQSLDMQFEKNNKSKSSKEAEEINILKTGYLFLACIKIACILGKANNEQSKLLEDYAINFGKAFQLSDDIDDAEIDNKSVELVKIKIKNYIIQCFNSLEQLNIKGNTSTENLKLIANYCTKNL